MKRKHLKKINKSISAVLAAAMSLSVFTSIPAAAENGSASAVGKTTYTYDNYCVEYYVTDAWSGSQNVELTVYNTGDESILNWALKYDAQGEISNLWNAGIYEQNDSEYVIRNVDWNFEIAPNQCVMYGYRLTGDDISLPEKFEICSKRVDVTENYDVTYKITNEWNTGVQGEIVITNYDDTPLEAWTLIFDSNFDVIDLWNGRVLENNGTSYTIAAEVWTNPVQPNSSMTIGFTGTKEAGTAAVLDNFRLTEVAIGEGNGTVTPVDPPAGDEEIEITANAAYDEENGNITVSWTSNNQDGTFDILMSADGENFTSIGTVSGVSEYTYTPESDFDTLYFKVVQTVGEQSADSNVVSVTNTNSSSEDINISANGVYDEESGNITISWETNTDNGSFEIFMSEDGEEFVTIGTVEGVSEYVYTPSTDFEEIYFKVIQTADSKSAESNIVTVNNSIVLAIITSANYDEESGNIKVSWITSFNKGTYEIFVSEDDENFTSLGIVENAKEYIYTPKGEFIVLYFKVKQTVGELTAESDSAAAYYPIDWEDTADTDNDGLTDVYEKYYFETDPTNPDTDGDGLPDGYEVYFLGTDPKKADSDDNSINDGDEDFDSDGLSNFREYELGTDPNNADSDNDGLTDSEEVNTYNTDPLKYDTDDDGVSDGDEIALGLDPNNAATDGTPDSERTFMQHVGVDSENFAAINTSENPFEVSIDITAAGVAANNLYSHKSGYSNAIKNDAILGVTPEFTYTDGLKVEDVIINFTVNNSSVNNYNNKYTCISDEFVGIKRLNVFKFFEDTNMLLPIETFHDVENNRVYTHTDELGTYCLMDMEMWLESLGITAEDLAGDSNISTFSTRSMIALYSDDSEASEEEEDQECLDVVFVVYPWNDMNENVRPELSYISQKIIKQAKSENISVRVYYVNFLSDVLKSSETGLPYATTAAETNEISYRVPGINNRAFTSSDYPLYKAFNYINSNLINNLQSDSERYCFVIDSYAEPECNSVGGKLEPTAKVLKENGFELYFACNKNNANFSKYSSIATDALCSEISITDMPADYVNAENIKRRYNFGDFVYDTIYEDVYPTFTATGWTQIKLDEPIIEKYRSVSMAIENDPELRQDVVDLGKYADTDKDGLLDLEEIYYDRDGRAVVLFDEKGKVVLPTFEECMDLEESLFYVEAGFDRYTDSLGQAFFEQLADVRILPIKSNPANKDSDEDGINDNLDDQCLICNKLPDVFVSYINSEKVKMSEIIFDKKEQTFICTKSIYDLKLSYDVKPLYYYDEFGCAVKFSNSEQVVQISEGAFINWYFVATKDKNNINEYNYTFIYSNDINKVINTFNRPAALNELSKIINESILPFRVIREYSKEHGVYETIGPVAFGIIAAAGNNIAAMEGVVTNEIYKIYHNLQQLGSDSNDVIPKTVFIDEPSPDYAKTFVDTMNSKYAEYIDTDNEAYKAGMSIGYTFDCVLNAKSMIDGISMIVNGVTIFVGGVAFTGVSGNPEVVALTVPIATAEVTAGVGITCVSAVTFSENFQSACDTNDELAEGVRFESIEEKQARADKRAKDYNDSKKPYEHAIEKGCTNITKTKNGGVSYQGSEYIYKKDGKEMYTKVKMTGSRKKDFAYANSNVGLDEIPDGYVWHHLDDYNVETGECTLELITKKAHTDGKPHSGACAQYTEINGGSYKP